MVGFDALSQQTRSAVKQLFEHHDPDQRQHPALFRSPNGSGAPNRWSARPKWRSRSAPKWLSSTRRSGKWYDYAAGR
jgi:hypothetical protein